MRIFSYLHCAWLVALLGAANPLRADDKVIVHEWGTFTCLQDEHGAAIQGINVDDEPAPPFVYDQSEVTVTAQYSQSKGNFGLPPYQNFHSKGWVPGDPQVTMRLETPVIYFYPPKGQLPASVPPLDVHVDFHGGILSQYYPSAQLDISNTVLDQVNNTVGSLIFRQGDLYGMTSSLTWKGVRLGSTGKPVETDDKVWITPREVSAPQLEVQAPVYDNKGQRHDEAQAEHFLFYRGVGHLDSPIFIQSNIPDKRGELSMGGRMCMNGHTYVNPEPIGHLDGGWIVEIHPDGKCAFNASPGFDAGGMSLGCAPYWPPVSATFSNSDFTATNLSRLKISMHDALVKEGLYDDEATAMLKTWELSYFKSPGLRFFYIVPRTWVDEILPLKITGAPTEITRVMVGRIELITDAQKLALGRLATGPCPDLAAVKMAAQDALQNSKLPKNEVDAFYRGEKPLSELGIAIPPLVKNYLSLGRFRDALIVHEQQQHPSAALAQFIKDNGLTSGN